MKERNKKTKVYNRGQFSLKRYIKRLKAGEIKFFEDYEFAPNPIWQFQLNVNNEWIFVKSKKELQ